MGKMTPLTNVDGQHVGAIILEGNDVQNLIMEDRYEIILSSAYSQDGVIQEYMLIPRPKKMRATIRHHNIFDREG